MDKLTKYELYIIKHALMYTYQGECKVSKDLNAYIANNDLSDNAVLMGTVDDIRQENQDRHRLVRVLKGL